MNVLTAASLKIVSKLSDKWRGTNDQSAIHSLPNYGFGFAFGLPSLIIMINFGLMSFPQAGRGGKRLYLSLYLNKFKISPLKRFVRHLINM